MNAGPHRSLLVVTPLLLLLLTSCSGGSATPAPPDPPGEVPAITGIRLVAGEPNEGQSLTVAAETDVPAVAFQWSLGDGVIPTASELAEPVVQCVRAGFYSGQVRARNAESFGTWHTFQFRIGTATPPVGDVVTFTRAESTTISGNPSPPRLFGSAPGMLRYDIDTSSGGLPQRFQWDLSGGTFQGPTTSSVVAYIPGPAGNYTGTVRASNAYGDVVEELHFIVETQTPPPVVTRIDEETLPRGMIRLAIDYTPQEPPLQHFEDFSLGTLQMHVTSRDPRTQLIGAMELQTQTRGRFVLDLCTEPGEPLTGDIVHCVFGNCSDPTPVEATTGAPTPDPIWTTSNYAPIRGSIHYQQLVFLEDRLHVVYIEDINDELTYLRSRTPLPETQEDWDVMVIGEADAQINLLSLRFRDGNPFVIRQAWLSESVTESWESSAELPMSGSDWTRRQWPDDTLWDGDDGSLAMTSGGTLWVLQSLDGSPGRLWWSDPGADLSLASGWSNSVIGPTDPNSALVEASGQPLIVSQRYATPLNVDAFLGTASGETWVWRNHEIALFPSPFELRRVDTNGLGFFFLYAGGGPTPTSNQYGTLFTAASPPQTTSDWQVIELPNIDVAGPWIDWGGQPALAISGYPGWGLLRSDTGAFLPLDPIDWRVDRLPGWVRPDQAAIGPNSAAPRDGGVITVDPIREQLILPIIDSENSIHLLRGTAPES